MENILAIIHLVETYIILRVVKRADFGLKKLVLGSVFLYLGLIFSSCVTLSGYFTPYVLLHLPPLYQEMA